jgi:hypothetical protein
MDSLLRSLIAKRQYLHAAGLIRSSQNDPVGPLDLDAAVFLETYHAFLFSAQPAKLEIALQPGSTRLKNEVERLSQLFMSARHGEPNGILACFALALYALAQQDGIRTVIWTYRAVDQMSTASRLTSEELEVFRTAAQHVVNPYVQGLLVDASYGTSVGAYSLVQRAIGLSETILPYPLLAAVDDFNPRI